MIELIEKLHQICQKNNLKFASEKYFYVLLTVKFLGHETGNQTIKPIHSKVDGKHKLKTPASKCELMRFIGSISFYSKFIQSCTSLSNFFYTLLHEDVSLEWTPDLNELFESIKLSLKKEADLVTPDTSKPFYITVDDSLIGLGAVLFQPNSNNKLQGFSYSSPVLSIQEQHFSTYDRKLCAVYFALALFKSLFSQTITHSFFSLLTTERLSYATTI